MNVPGPLHGSDALAAPGFGELSGHSTSTEFSFGAG
jgi:hypothetical protein